MSLLHRVTPLQGSEQDPRSTVKCLLVRRKAVWNSIMQSKTFWKFTKIIVSRTIASRRTRTNQECGCCCCYFGVISLRAKLPFPWVRIQSSLFVQLPKLRLTDISLRGSRIALSCCLFGHSVGGGSRSPWWVEPQCPSQHHLHFCSPATLVFALIAAVLSILCKASVLQLSHFPTHFSSWIQETLS